ncbi:TonB-dependent receptor [Brevundimonas variabilis]|uniref:TonB-dependent receptor n=1 Tax=Brevundimonas variabilis TaxID=74312 RepID=A0A7W9FEN1_9CAUL|nr:TonB-dependent receptor [Brevundimonas variabilis]MBB5746470.1 hypothetical protein [Brevundimonas variabilis]
MTLLALAFTALTAIEPTAAVAVPASEVSAQQERPRSAQEEVVDLGEVVVTGQRPRGSVQGDISPDIVLDAEQLRAYGAGNIAELLTALEPLTRSNRGRADAGPILLVNGRRISGFREIQGIPFEAIERTEILPEEVALTYGYTADQRVVNFVLKAQFRAVTAQAQVRGPTQGGRTSTEFETNLFRIQEGDRWSFDLERQDDGALYEDERDITRTADAGPFSLGGTVTGAPRGALLDPRLPGVVIAAVPGSATNGRASLADFAAGAGQTSPEDLIAYRTLLARRSENSASGSLTRDLNNTTSGTIRASIEDSTSESFLGLPGLLLNIPTGSAFSPFANNTQLYRYLDQPDALARTVDTLEFEAATVLDGFIGDYRWTFNGNYNRTETETQTGRGFDTTALQAGVTAGTVNPFGALPDNLLNRFADDTARSVSSLVSGELVLAGDVFELPAGGVNGTVTIGADTRSLDSESFRNGLTTETSLSRDRYRIQGNLTAPLTNRQREVLGGFGDLSANVNFGYEELSDFGGLTTLGGGLNWTPIEPLSFVGSVTLEEAAPSIQQLNDPSVVTPNVQVFDFATGQTVTVLRTDGGNADLLSDSRTVWKLGVNFKPWSARDLTFSTNYTASEIEDQVASFPTITPDLEAAFPGRFTRDATGRLVAFDARAVNYASAERQELRTGFNFSKAFGTPNAAAAAMSRLGGGRPGGGFGGFGGGGGRPPGAGGGGGSFTVQQGGPGGGGGGVRRGGSPQLPGQGRFNLSIYHTVRFQDEITIRDNLPVIDLLDGGAVGGRGGQPRNEIQVQGGVFRNGFGSFLNANWREGTRVDGGTNGQDLFFSGQTTVNLNAFLDFNQRANMLTKFPWLKNARINVGVQNLFDSRLEVTDQTGITPIGYQRDRLDPQGRVVSLNLRKLF